MLQFLPAILSLGSMLLGKGAQKSAEGRVQEATLNQGQDALRNDQYQTQQNAEFNQGNLDLNRKTFEENSRGGRAKQALIGSLLQNMQDVSLNVPGVEGGSVSGGLRPSALGEMGRFSAGTLAQQALLKQLTGDTFEGGDVLTPPPLTAQPQASGWEKAAGIGSILSGLAGGIGGIMQGNGLPKITSTVGANPNPDLFKGVRF